MTHDRPAWITRTQLAVLQQLVAFLEDTATPYVVSGGLAGNLHGSAWPLHDIDVDVPDRALAMLAEHFRSHVQFGPATYRDDEFALRLLSLEIDDVHVDVSAAESVTLVHPDGRLEPYPTSLRTYDVRVLHALRLPVMPLESLITYKQRIGRHTDVEALRALRETP